METKLVKQSDLKRIVDTLNSGEVVAFPTDTVFGIGVVFHRCDAVRKMKVAKGRPETKPFPLMVADVSAMQKVAFLSEREIQIAQKFTPGALTMVLRKKDDISDEFTNGLPTIAIRIPDNPFVLELLKEVGPMFVTSANLSNQPACNTSSEVMEALNGRIAMVVEGRATSFVASTILDCTGPQLKVLRQGELTLEEINKVLDLSE